MITLDNIKKSNPVLVVYPAGTGGEHIAHTMSICSNEFEDLQTTFVGKKNQFHTVCALNYSTSFSDINVFSTSIDSRYKGNFYDTGKRIVLKDHPTDMTLDFYSRNFSNINVIFVTPVNEVDYFSKLTFKKLAVKIPTPITKEYIQSEIFNTLTDIEYNHLIDQANCYPWVWRHELHILTHQIREHGKLVPLEHYDNLDKIENDHTQTLINTYEKVLPEYTAKFKNLHLINCDTLRYESEYFWSTIKKIIPSLHLDRAVEITNNWIEKNNKLEVDR
jgi:MFS superfamily sulfate permease-like transporter